MARVKSPPKNSLHLAEICTLPSEFLGGDLTLATPPFKNVLRGHVRTVLVNMLAKFRVHGSDLQSVLKFVLRLS